MKEPVLDNFWERQKVTTKTRVYEQSGQHSGSTRPAAHVYPIYSTLVRAYCYFSIQYIFQSLKMRVCMAIPSQDVISRRYHCDITKISQCDIMM